VVKRAIKRQQKKRRRGREERKKGRDVLAWGLPQSRGNTKGLRVDKI